MARVCVCVWEGRGGGVMTRWKDWNDDSNNSNDDDDGGGGGGGDYDDDDTATTKNKNLDSHF